ncbi:hypothetical protein M427DRAFT_54540 [Gonapodya prolifera JEL478]|uniref:Uncharacterized protein n=1 Tax=Gonapodya prolifera (strain JEL478) TaxID=1344416 RepID=A0A139AM27_GONPJ|nr:hypothetical protein M427DRAFT_54540 [Gonapodya prolifera JEL478]|eukprot:KXS17614.1 hypothetical protein M427DRAFT_54540 [Gonapodya prolifera JEL478]
MEDPLPAFQEWGDSLRTHNKRKQRGPSPGSDDDRDESVHPGRRSDDLSGRDIIGHRSGPSSPDVRMLSPPSDRPGRGSSGQPNRVDLLHPLFPTPSHQDSSRSRLVSRTPSPSPGPARRDALFPLPPGATRAGLLRPLAPSSSMPDLLAPRRSSSSSPTGGSKNPPVKRRKGRDGRARATSPGSAPRSPADTFNPHSGGGGLFPAYRPVERWLRSPSPASSFLSAPGETWTGIPAPSPEPPLYEDPEEEDDFDGVGTTEGDGNDSTQHGTPAWYYHPRITVGQDSGVDMDDDVSAATEAYLADRREAIMPDWLGEAMDHRAKSPFNLAIEVEMMEDNDREMLSDSLMYSSTWQTPTAGSFVAMDTS